MRKEFTGCILDTRAVEDCIRATKKYTKGAFSKDIHHPIQGKDFPSKVITEYYEVYPDVDISWDMPASTAWAWVWGDTAHIDVRFNYNYQKDLGRVVIFGNNGVINLLKESIPNLEGALIKLKGGREN